MYVVVGEALVDLVGQRGGRTFTAHPGGSPANIALGLARLGAADVSLLTQLGEDAFGQMIRSHLEGNGVTLHLMPDPRGQTSIAIAHLAAGVASYDFRIHWDPAQLPALPATTLCLHTGSLATALQPGADAVLDLVRHERESGRALISYDPNVRPTLLADPQTARPQIERIVALSDIVKVSDEDLAWLYPGQDHQVIARRWLATGPALVVVTLGAHGAYATNHRREVTRPAVQVQMVDTVGAGDAFTSGLLDALGRDSLLGRAHRDALANTDQATLSRVLDRAALVAAITCSRPGSDPPTQAEVTTATRANPTPGARPS